MAEGIAAVREILAKLGDRHSQPIEARRAGMEAFLGSAPLPADVIEEEVRLGEVPALQVAAENADPGRALLILHGGAFVAGSARSHRGMGAVLSKKAGAVAYVANYRLAPEAPFPAALEDAVTAWRELTDDDCVAAAIVGDSAGGGLAVSTAVEIRDQALTPPRAIACLSPWVDLRCDAPSYSSHASRDPFLTPDGLRQDAQTYLQSASPHDPRASPLVGNLAGLAPFLVQVGSEEILIDDATRLVERVQEAGGTANLEVWPEMIHVFHAFEAFLPEAEEALDQIAKFLSTALR